MPAEAKKVPVVNGHLDDFTLLRYAARDLKGDDLSGTVSHLESCAKCESTFVEITNLDRGLRRLASEGRMGEAGSIPFDSDDPFRKRPAPQHRKVPPAKRHFLAPDAIHASEEAFALQELILQEIRTSETSGFHLEKLTLEQGAHRFALLYALQEAGRRTAENPWKALAFAKQSLRWLRSQPKAEPGSQPSDAELMVSRLTLRAQAHLLVAVACLWLNEFSRARAHLIVAYRSFASGSCDETSLAQVELAEAQRRGLAHEGLGALVLARRARQTFEAEGLEDYAARARVAEGLAYCALDRQEDAVRAYRRAISTFERYELWSNYVGALNSVATSLTILGRFEEARREYARALRRFSHERHRYWLGYLRIGLAEALLAAGRYPEAAIAASRAANVFTDCGLRAQTLIARLLEVEGWARAGRVDRAHHRLSLFWNEVERDGALDAVVARELADALSGADPSYERLSFLRGEIGQLIRQRYSALN
jgi:tetratricopeptide (TPR) repeat protein